MRYFGFNREDFVFVRPPGVQSFVLSPDNVWYGRSKLLFRITVQVDGKEDPVDVDCSFISFCYEKAGAVRYVPVVNNDNV